MDNLDLGIFIPIYCLMQNGIDASSRKGKYRMKAFVKHSVLAALALSLSLANVAEAARFGGGKKSGMQRSAPQRSYSTPAPTNSQPPLASAPQAPVRQGPGVGTAVAAGVAGAAAGYMLGSAMSDNHSGAPSATAPSTAASSPVSAGVQPAAPSSTGSGAWLFVLVLLGLTVAGFMFFRRMNQSAQPKTTPASPRAQFESASGAARVQQIGAGLGGGFSMNSASTRLPDGTEAPAFLRQAKASFLHVQTMNGAAQLESLNHYVTPALLSEVREQVMHNQEPADFPRLDCELLETATEGDQYIASVRFFGEVSESSNSAPVPFSEIWHFVKKTNEPLKWLVAGIQPE